MELLSRNRRPAPPFCCWSTTCPNTVPWDAVQGMCSPKIRALVGRVSAVRSNADQGWVV